MERQLIEIYSAFKGKLVGSKLMKKYVCETVLLLPKKTQKFITSQCWFLGSLEDAWAFTFTGNDLKDQHLVFLSDELFLESSHQIRFTILHEIGHVILGHKNSVMVLQTKEDITNQEEEANTFANGYLE